MISQSRYINIISGVGAGAGVAQRQLTLRVITQNTLLPPGVVMEFSNSDAVGAYFGVNSEEAKRASAYFSFISKNVQSPQSISFSRWVSAAIAPMIIGDSEAKNLAALVAIVAGTLTVNNGVTAIPVTAINFTGAASLTAAAALLQTKLRATADPQLLTCNVTFNTNTNQFVLTGTITGAGSLTVTPTLLATDISQLIGWGTAGTVYANGQAADTAVDAVSKSKDISNNFGSFVFATPAVAMTNQNIADVAAWNAAETDLFMYSVPTFFSNLSALYALVKGFAGTALNILSQTMPNDYIEQSPCEILAATNYDNANATQNFMYYQFPNRNITITTDANADVADLSRANYIGVTQSAGQQLAFYQRGVLCGGSTAALDMNTYANEMWLKSDVTAKMFGLFLSVARVPANEVGAAMILAVLQQSITQAKDNGVMSSGKTLSVTQQQFITQLSGDENAWRQIASIGYWMSINFSSFTTPDQRTEWQANYTLIYSKDDAIRVVNGSDVMI